MLNDDIIPGFDSEKDDSLKLDLIKIKNGIEIICTGYLDTYNSNFFLRRINLILNRGPYNLIFDCCNLDYISSTGIGAFATIYKTCRDNGGTLIFARISPKVYELFNLLGFSQFFVIEDSIDDAIALLAEGGKKLSDHNKCPNCRRVIKVAKPGKFRCGNCKSLINISPLGEITLL